MIYHITGLLSNSKVYQEGKKILAFLLAGLPSFLLALPINYILVEYYKWPEILAYALVLLCQVTINFFLCRLIVFKEHNGKPLLTQFWLFFSGILGFRVADWVIYAFLVQTWGFYYLGVQMTNIVLFSLLKFKFSERVIER
jgi:putative flippase GtrA